jgi:protein-tyrosine phosphatase
MYKFAAAAADESIVFGAARPGYTHQQVNDWLRFMQRQGVQRVCCLLPEAQLAPYTSPLMNTYEAEFGIDRVSWSPIPDFALADPTTLTQKILPFLAAADRAQEKVVVHCAAGIGRTGHVLAAWLVYGRGVTNRAAIAAVRKMGRNPYEAALAAPLKGRNPLQGVRALDTLLNDCRAAKD